MLFLDGVAHTAAGGGPRPPDLENLPEVDLFVALQGAFSANRFLPERKQGLEGAPYRDHAQRKTLIVLTWSRHDKANPFANRVTSANHVGGLPGYERATDPDYEHHFQHETWTAEGLLGSSVVPQEGRILYIDASKVIELPTYAKGGFAHNDIYRRQVGTGLWELMESATSD